MSGAGETRSVCPVCGRRSSGETCPVDGGLLEQPTDARVGTTVGKYRLARRLGEGGVGVVYLGVHETIESRVAIKVLRDKGPDDSPEFKRLLREAQAVNRIGHPHIVRILDSDRLPDGHPYLTMELLEGETLAERLGRGPPVTIRDAARWLDEVLSALDAAHAAGYVHRDLKPENIFIRREGDTRLLDFGIAKWAEAEATLTVDGAVVGTPLYLSPEQARGSNADIGPASDLYAFGVILFELLTGSAPFIGRTVTQLLMAHATEHPPSPRSLQPEVTPELEGIIGACLAKRKEDRPESAGALREPLSRALEAYLAQVTEHREPAVLPERIPADALLEMSPRGPVGPGAAADASPWQTTLASGEVRQRQSARRASLASTPGATAEPGVRSPRFRPPWETVGGRTTAGVVAVLGAILAIWFTLGLNPEREERPSGPPPTPGLGSALQDAGEDDGTAPTDASLVVALQSRTSKLDPNRLATADEARMVHEMCEGLLEMDPLTLEFRPKLAVGWQKVRQDTWRFDLRPGVWFHDGRPFDAETAVQALQTTFVVEKEVARSVRAVGPMAVEVETDEGSIFLSLVSSPQTLLSLEPSDGPGNVAICTGPYVPERVEFSRGIVEMVRFDRYWGPPGIPAKILFRTFPTPEDRIRSLLAGETHIAYGLPPQLQDRIEDHQDELEVLRSPPFSVEVLGFNVADPLLSDVEVRRALAMTLDFEALAVGRSGGPAVGLVPPAFGGGFVPRPAPYDPAEAARRIESLGLAGQTVSLAVLAEMPREQYAAVHDALETSGLEVEILRIPFRQLRSVTKEGELQLALSSIGMSFPDPLNWYGVFRTGHTNWVWGTFSSAEYDRLFAEAVAADDRGERDQLFARMDAILREELPGIPLSYFDMPVIRRRSVRGVEIDVNGMVSIAKVKP